MQTNLPCLETCEEGARVIMAMPASRFIQRRTTRWHRQRYPARGERTYGRGRTIIRLVCWYGDNRINPNQLNYRYGVNGKEMDNEVHENPTTGTVGTGNHYDYGFRVYDPRIAKFLSVDPSTKDCPAWSPYPYAMNRPIDGVDIDDLEWSQRIVRGLHRVN